MNIVRSHNYHVRNCSIADPEFFEDPAYLHESADCMTDFQSVTDISEYRCQECREVRNDADILAMETYKLSRACRKYKSKLEIIRENISNIILENELSDDEHEKIEKIPVFNPELSVIYGDLKDAIADEGLSPPDDVPEPPDDDPDESATMPDLKYIEN